MTLETVPHLPITTDDYILLDAKIDKAEDDGILGRWQFGKLLLEERAAHGGKQLPHGRLDELVEATKKSRSELQYRAQFAEQYPTREEVSNAVRYFPSWHEIVRFGLTNRMGVHYSSDTDKWETPQDLFDELDAEFHFTLDVCALPESAKCERYFSPDDDGLTQEWTGVCWMNPPYGSVIVEWMTKARASAEAGATVVCLVPARTDTSWWWDNCLGGQIRFLRGRLKFGGGDAGAPFPSAVVILGPNVKSRVVWWDRGRP